MARIAVIGAGLAGLVFAREMSATNEVVLFEKSRGVGGRMATRYADPYRFDHGAQFFTARSAAFRNYLRPFLSSGVVAPWHARFAELTGDTITSERSWNDDHPHYVGAPGMNALPKALSEGLDIRLGVRIAGTNRDAGSWTLSGDDGSVFDGFDWLVCTQPSPQVAPVVGAVTALSERARSATMKACYALMLGFEQRVATPFDAARVLQADISWISVNSSKPQRSDDFTLVVHATNAWADAHIELDLPEARSHMLQQLQSVTGIDGSKASEQQIHRWRYANADKQAGPPCLVDRESRIAACGDWFIRGRVEAAFKSAIALADEFKTIS
ncbi:MAG: FAD-dependent oxidoreductase [Woeseiaceae bacterium]|nr:FAD-dependent oxidoreductase [Woeseiaceae bacterium]